MPEDDEDRVLFEKHLSSILIRCNKNIITFFVGKTKAGKSTIKDLIKNVLGDNNYIQLSTDIYTNLIDSHKPHSSKGKISYRLCSFAHEPGEDKILKSENIKLLTETVIKARQLNSNKDDQVNFLTQFIDCNQMLSLDFEDPAAIRRIAIINFNSFFTEKDNKHSIYTILMVEIFRSSMKIYMKK